MRTEGAGENVMGVVKIKAMTTGLNQYINSSIYILPYLVSSQSKIVKEPNPATSRSIATVRLTLNEI